MAQIHWKSDVSGYFGDGADWSTGAAPGAGDDAILNAPGKTPFTVTAAGSYTVHGIELAKTATLDIAAGNFTATDGSSKGANAGTIAVSANASLTLGGVMDNKGVISVTSGFQANGNLIVEATGVTLTGGGVIDLAPQFGRYDGTAVILGAAAGATLTNFDNTLSGGGNIGNNGNGNLTLVNDAAGVIDATEGLVIDTGTQSVTNAGTIEATNGGALILQSAVNNAGGTILAGAASGVTLEGVDVIGGALNTRSGGTISALGGGNELDGIVSAVSNEGTLGVRAIGNETTSLTLQGAIDNVGVIVESSAFQANANVIVGAAGATLSGGGSVELTGGGRYYGVSQIYGVAAGATLTNVNDTISGNGNIGNGGTIGLTLVNEPKGVIDATGGMTLDTGAATTTNAGLIEATGGGVLTIESAVNNATTGTISAGDASTVNLAGADIIGGTLETQGSGMIVQNAAVSGSILDGTGAPVKNKGVVEVTGDANNSVASLTVLGAIDNSGALALVGGFQCRTELLVGAAGVTLTGGGAVTMTNPGGNYVSSPDIYGVSATDTLTNFDNTISGEGNIGNSGAGAFTLINDAKGVIDATGGMTLNTGADTAINAGLIEATGGGVLTIQSAVNGSSGGTISAGAGATISLQGADIVGGTLEGSGVFLQAAGVSGSLLDGTTSPVVNRGVVEVVGDANNSIASLTIAGAIDNIGVISVTTGFQCRADLIIGAGGATLTGGGDLVLARGAGNYVPDPAIYGAAAGATLTNFDGTISGSGTIGNSGSGAITLINDAGGVIDATGALVLDSGSQSIVNEGTIEVSGGGVLTLMSAINGAGGTLFAGAGADLMLQNSIVNGGQIGTAAGGVITLVNGAAATVDGTMSNAGTIALAGSGTATSLIFDKNSSLTGGGTLALSANSSNIVEGSKASIILTNVNDTIEGSGKLGDRKLTLVNETAGVIDADDTVALSINIGAAVIMNAGVIEATNKGKGVIASAVANTGTIEANGGTVILQAAVTGSGVVAVASGTLDISNANAAEDVAFTGKTGELELGRSQTFTGQVSGFSLGGKTALDLRDINYVDPGEATFSGNTNGGVLTVTDGTRTAHIALAGDYLNSTFVASDDGHGGAKIVDPTAPQVSTHAMVAAMAGFGADSATSVYTTLDAWRAPASMLMGPRLQIA